MFLPMFRFLALLAPVLLLSGGIEAQVLGCTDPLANNFNAAAQQNDGSCTYPLANIAPISSVVLPAAMLESSGLVLWDGAIWTHNDSNDTLLYAFDPANVAGYQSHALSGVQNVDWEEIAQDSLYLYLGDFGNNANGNRTDLKVLRILKNSLLSNAPIIDTIFFSYAQQTDFSGSGSNHTDFDCEGMLVSHDSIYLFTKQWIGNQSSIYALPKWPGVHVAALRATYNVQGLITGATYLEPQRLVVLCGYSVLLQPFVYLLYDFQGNQFFSGNKRRLNISLPFHQIEGICTADGLHYYLSNEKFVQSLLSVEQKLHQFDLTPYLDAYLNPGASNIAPLTNQSLFRVSSLGNFLQLRLSERAIGQPYSILSMNGALLQSGRIESSFSTLDLRNLPAGNYVIWVQGQPAKQFLKW